jgi:peptidoglycan/xylan/chitin deacetylase (PgdA/CDA1 family)
MAESVWPNVARSAAFFSFDLDGESWLLWGDERNAERPVTISQAQYGPRVGVFEILRLLRRYEVPATFFIPSWIAEHYPRALEAVLDGGHEVALHGHLHEHAETMKPEEEEEVLAKSIEILTRLTGKKPIGHRPPGGEASPITIPLLGRYGIRYSSGYMDDVFPYFHEDTDVLELPFQWVCDDWWYSMVAPYALPTPDVHEMVPNADIVSLWTSMLDGVSGMGGLFVLVCHPQVTGRPHRLATLEAILQAARNAGDIWIAKGEQIDPYWRQANSVRPDPRLLA